MDFTLVLFIVVAIVVLIIVIYNRLVALRQARMNAFADIDVQLKLRHDLVPNLVETVKGYATHEKGILEEVTASRARAVSANGVNDKIAAETALSRSLMNLYAVAENYPQLKANENFAKLQDELSDVENKIAASRRFFNNATSEYNTSIGQFPAVLFAGRFGFHTEQFFDVGDEERKGLDQPVPVKF